jgi:hypothetical protein
MRCVFTFCGTIIFHPAKAKSNCPKNLPGQGIFTCHRPFGTVEYFRFLVFACTSDCIHRHGTRQGRGKALSEEK